MHLPRARRGFARESCRTLTLLVGYDKAWLSPRPAESELTASTRFLHVSPYAVVIAHDRENNIASLSGKKNSQSESSTSLEVLSKPSKTDARVQMRHPKGAFQTINSVLNDF